MGFEEDHFSARAALYARSRPVYPEALYATLASLTPGQALAWDCGTGSGQAAAALARRFDRVLASDASPQQVSHAFAHEHVHYAIARAEAAPLRDRSVDLVTVAAAVHWFDLDPFYAEARRVLRPGGVLAVWTYLEMRVSADFDEVMDRYIRETLETDWPSRMQYPLAHYRNLPFPVVPLEVPRFESELRWTLHDVRAFVQTWSGTQRHASRTGTDPFEASWPRFVELWGAPDTERIVRWPLHLKAGRFD